MIVDLFSFYLAYYLLFVSLTPVLLYFAIGSPRVGYGLAILSVSRVAFPKQDGTANSAYAFATFIVS